MKARIYRQSKSAMQSGFGRAGQWIFEYDKVPSSAPEGMMGWTTSDDTLSQVRLNFSTLEEATAFADKKGLLYVVSTPHERNIKPRNYGDNFRYVPFEDKKNA